MLPYRIVLPNVSHTFLPGHRIMVQIQSTWFPLYDRNPQTYVPNILFATPESYAKATQRIWHSPNASSAIELPIVGTRRCHKECVGASYCVFRRCRPGIPCDDDQLFRGMPAGQVRVM